MQISDEMLERAASAMYSHGDKGVWKNLEEHRKLFWRSYALAALEATLPAAEPSVQAQDVSETELAYKEARQLAVSIHAQHYRDVTNWKPFDDLRGVISQIDNMVCGLALVPDGSQIVPKIPTKKMQEAYGFEGPDFDYHAMLAAAPDLLSALKYAGELLEYGGFDMSVIQSAIAKAEGRSHD